MACLTGSTAAWPLSSSFFLTRAFKRPRQRAKALSSPNHPVDTFRASGTGDIPLAEQSSAPAPKSAIAMSGEFANSANLFPTRIIFNDWFTRQDSYLLPLPSELEPLPYSMLLHPSPKPSYSFFFIGFFLSYYHTSLLHSLFLFFFS